MLTVLTDNLYPAHMVTSEVKLRFFIQCSHSLQRNSGEKIKIWRNSGEIAIKVWNILEKNGSLDKKYRRINLFSFKSSRRNAYAFYPGAKHRKMLKLPKHFSSFIPLKTLEFLINWSSWFNFNVLRHVA